MGKVRHPFACWLLPLITCGIYSLYIHFKFNDEARQYDGRIAVEPILSLFALMLPIFNIVSVVRTGARISRAQQAAGLPARCSGWLGLLLGLFFGLHVPYYQSHLNQIWAIHGNQPEGTAI